jgi:HK97 family phage major capsid protein
MDRLDTHIDEALDHCDGGPSALETKSAIDARQRAWSRFRQVNDQQHSLSARGQADPLLNEELDRLNGELDTKALGAPRGAPRRGAPATSGDHVKQAVVSIGREVLRQGQVIDRMARGSRPTDISSIEAKTRAMRARTAERTRLAEVKRDRPPGLGAHLGPPARRDGALGSYLNRPEVAFYRKAVHAYLRTGREVFDGVHLDDLARKSMHTELNPDGGYLVLPEHDRSPLATYLREISRMRQRAEVRQITSAELKRPTRTAPADGDWGAERQPATETAAPKVGEQSFVPHMLWAMPAITQVMLDDASLDIETWLTGEVAETFAVKESDAWFNGNGITQPRGLLTYPFVTPANWAHGSFRYNASGFAGAFPASNPHDTLLGLVYGIKTPHRANASWLFNRSTIGVIRTFKASDGHYLWQPSQQLGQPDMLEGYATDEDEFMPSIGTDTMSVGFGDWRKTYLIVDRIGVRVLRDPYSVKGQVSFYTSKRTGGGVQFFDAAIFLKFAVS